ncbi:uncharacterized protein [Eurosta solidaginis]|uniref:uncharacterized protein isoform X3 n=1 Tax=Eurosta solidaginis TaxID=178769 RepID=UPI003530C5ED
MESTIGSKIAGACQLAATHSPLRQTRENSERANSACITDTLTINLRATIIMQTLLIFVALIFLRLQIALPLHSSYDYDFHRDIEFAESKNLVQRHHLRHKPSQFRSSDSSSRRQEHIKMQKIETATEFFKQEDIADSSIVERHSHYQQQYKLHPERNNLRTNYNSHYQQHDEHHNSIHAEQTNVHLPHRNVSKPRTITMAATTINSERSTNILRLVKPTSFPKAILAHTITLDDVKKTTQNYYQQSVKQQQHGQQLQQNKDKWPLNSDLTETNLTVVSVNGFDHDLSAIRQMNTDHNKLVRASGSLYSGSHKDESVINIATELLPEQSTSVGGINEIIGVTTSEPTIDGTSEAQLDNDGAIDYLDNDVEYYDYNGDLNNDPLASDNDDYYYDSSIDDYEADWPVHAAKNSNIEFQHTRHLRERTQPQKRQQLHRKKKHNLEAQHYQHSRVARDHHRVQSQLGDNQLVYDSRSEDEYPDDEPYKGSSEQFPNQIGELTLQKFRELGTMQAVQQSRDLYIQRQKSQSDLATEHINLMKVAARCSRPLPRVIHVSNDTSKTYIPTCTILHRCGEDTGCCRSMGQVCTVKTYEDVPLHFIVIQVNSSNSRRQTDIEMLMLRNDTECHCINRTDLTSSPELNTRDKRSGLAIRRRNQLQFYDLDSQNLRMNRNDSENDPDGVCKCPKHFDVFQENIRLPQRQDEFHSSSVQVFNCRCDCADIASPCQRFKNGEEGFAMDDRRCIADKICSIPNCSNGIFNEQTGRCPRPMRTQKRRNNGFG